MFDAEDKNGLTIRVWAITGDTQHMNKEIKIRQEQENDFQAVREVVELAFRDVEDSDQSEPYLVERLRKTDAYIPELSLVAELNGEIIGHLMMSKVEIV